MATKTTHTHKFKRLKYKTGNVTFFCALPDCNVKINPSLALGKRSLCWRCGEPFILTEYSLRLAKPHCESCHKPKNNMNFNEADRYTTADEVGVATNDNLSLAERLQQTLSGVNLPEEIEDEL